MYQKYQTEAVVLGGRDIGECDRAVALFTRDFGLVWARATGVRKEVSKMRCAVPLHAVAQVALVKGKSGWRLAGAISLAAPLRAAEPSGLAVFARIAMLVTRLVTGEERNEYLYDTLVSAHTALAQNADLGRSDLPRSCEGQTFTDSSAVELLCVARILYSLGYLSADALGTALFAHTALAEPHLTEAVAMYDPLLASVNNALAAARV